VVFQNTILNSVNNLQISRVRQFLSSNCESSEAMLKHYSKISLMSQNYQLVEILGGILGFDKLKQEALKKLFQKVMSSSKKS